MPEENPGFNCSESKPLTRQYASVCVRFSPCARRRLLWYLLLLGVELEALGERAGLRLMVLLPVQVHALGVRDVLLLGVSEQTAGGDRGAETEASSWDSEDVIWSDLTQTGFCQWNLFPGLELAELTGLTNDDWFKFDSIRQKIGRL